MRTLALLLIIVNLGYLGWATLIDVRPGPPPADDDIESAPRLMLASERVPQPSAQQPIRVAAIQPVEPPAVARCLSIGPFQDLPTVTQASAVLNGVGYEPKQRLEQGELWVGHWVSAGGFATHDEAQLALARLKEKGITDATILPGSDAGNVISLGVFKDHERAQRRLNEAKNLGLKATLADRTRSGSVYWVDLDLNGREPPDLATLSAQPGKIVRLETRPCPQSSNG